MNWFKLYIGDYQRDTAHLSITEHGAYMLMLQHYYATERPLPIGKALHRMLRAQDKAERDAIDTIAAQFWAETPAGLVNARADDELAKAGAQADTNRAIALAREAKRKEARGQHDDSTNRSTKVQPNQTPDTRHQTTTKTARKRAAPAVLVSVSDLEAEGVNSRHAEDWLTARKAKGLPLTPTAWQQTKDEAAKAGLSIAAAIQTAAANGWAGFKASWLVNADAPRGQAPAAVTTPGSDYRADAFLADQDQRAATATKPPAAILALAGKAIERAA